MREQVFWGWGEPGAGPALPEHADAFLREELGRARRGASTRRWRSRTCALPRAARCPRRRARPRAAVGAEHVLDDRETRVLRCRGKSYLDLLAQRAGDCEARARRGRAPARPRPRSRRCCARARRRGVAVVPFGGGTSVVGGLEAARDGLRGRRLARPRARWTRLVSVDERSLTAVLEPGHAAAGGRARAARARAHARARPAELRVGDGRRLRRDPLGRAVLDRARADRRERGRAALRDARRRAGHARRARERRRARRCASWWSAPRARSA